MEQQWTSPDLTTFNYIPSLHFRFAFESISDTIRLQSSSLSSSSSSITNTLIPFESESIPLSTTYYFYLRGTQIHHVFFIRHHSPSSLAPAALPAKIFTIFIINLGSSFGFNQFKSSVISSFLLVNLIGVSSSHLRHPSHSQFRFAFILRASAVPVSII